MVGDTDRRRTGAGEPHGGELAGGSYLSRPHHEPPEGREHGRRRERLKKEKAKD